MQGQQQDVDPRHCDRGDRADIPMRSASSEGVRGMLGMGATVGDGGRLNT